MQRRTFLKASALTLLFASPYAIAGETHVVKMLNAGADGIMVYEPAFLKINVGDTVHFQDTTPGHNAVSEITPSGEKWEVGYTGGKVTFTDEGVHLYYCTPHKMMGMYGVIQVGEAVNKDHALAEAKKIASGIPLNGDRLERYVNQAN